MPFRVLLTNDAARDLDDLYDSIALHDAPQKADYVLVIVDGRRDMQSLLQRRLLDA